MAGCGKLCSACALLLGQEFCMHIIDRTFSTLTDGMALMLDCLQICWGRGTERDAERACDLFYSLQSSIANVPC